MIHLALVHWPMTMRDDCSMIGLEELVFVPVPCPTTWPVGELERHEWEVLVVSVVRAVPVGCRDGESTVADSLRMTGLP